MYHQRYQGLLLILIPKISAASDRSSKLPGPEVESSSLTLAKVGMEQQMQ